MSKASGTPRVPVGTELYRMEAWGRGVYSPDWHGDAGYRPPLRYEASVVLVRYTVEAHTPTGMWLQEQGGERVWRKVGGRAVWLTQREALAHLLARKRAAVRYAREALAREEAALGHVQDTVSRSMAPAEEPGEAF